MAFWGYSQGGGAAASAAELASSYAPDLNVVGTYAGAPPADLDRTVPLRRRQRAGRGDRLRAQQRHPDLPGGRAARSGRKLTRAGPGLLDQDPGPVRRRDDRQVHVPAPAALLQRSRSQSCCTTSRFSGLFDLQRIGTLKPNAPVLINSNRYDPLVPWTRGQSARPGLVRQGRRRRVPHQRAATVPEQAGGQPRAADARRRRAGDAVDRRSVQRSAHRTELRTGLRTPAPDRRAVGRPAARLAGCSS